MSRERPLFRHMARMLAWALAAQLVFAMVVLVPLVLVPLTDRAAQDKADLVVLSAKTWLELPPGTRPDFEDELFEQHGLTLLPGISTAETVPSDWLPYPYLLQRALDDRLEAEPEVGLAQGMRMIQVQFKVRDQLFTARFELPNLLTRRLIALGLGLLGSTLLAGLVALGLSRRIARPLEAIARMSERWGQGREAPQPLAACDIQEVRELASRLEAMMHAQRQHENERTALLAGVSHDLRTPLARLRLALEMLPDEQGGGVRSGMVRDVEAMDRLIGEALQLARSDSAQEEMVDLVELGRKMAEDYRRQHVDLVFDGPDGACQAPCAPHILKRILGNLIDNAWRYGGFQLVGLILRCEKDVVRFEVLDRGPGIPEDMREAVFHPFVRLEPSRNVATGGSGLGLSIARQLAQAQGWSLSLDAREGGGTRVTLLMPRTNDQDRG